MIQETKDLQERMKLSVVWSIAGFVLCTVILIVLLRAKEQIEKNLKRIDTIELNQAANEIWKSKVEQNLNLKIK